MNLTALLRGERVEVEVRRDGDGAYRVSVNGRPLTVDLAEPERDLLSLRIGGGSYEAAIRSLSGGFDVTVAGRTYRIEILDRAALAGGSGVSVAGTQVVRSVMAGKVLDVLVSEGAEIGAGTPLVVIEAMKMENEIRSPKAGTVKRIAVRPGQAVEAGADLVVVE